MRTRIGQGESGTAGKGTNLNRVFLERKMSEEARLWVVGIQLPGG